MGAIVRVILLETKMKIHLHSEQFDDHMHPWCGRGKTAVPERVFEATPRAIRCNICDKEWFPTGQPDWHYRESLRKIAEK